MATITAIDLEDFLPATFTAPELTDEQFLAMCELFPEATLEYTEEGEIIMPPTDPNHGYRGALVVQRLGDWVEKTGRGGHPTLHGSRATPQAGLDSPCSPRSSSSKFTRLKIALGSFTARCGGTSPRGCCWLG